MVRCALPSACIALLALAAPAAADTIKVPKDFATINEAVAAAVAGDTVSVSKGTYVEQVVVAVSGIKLVGKQAVIDAEYGGACIDIQADDVGVSGFTLVNGTTCLFAQGSNINVSKCQVHNAGINGISISGGAAVISGNTVTACGNNGIQYVREAIGDSLIEKNTSTQNGVDGISATGDGLTLSKNRCELNAARGILVNVQALSGDGAPASPPVTVEKNTCRSNDAGLFLLNGTASVVTISKNDCSDNGDRGLIVDAIDPVITGNSCEDNINSGMHLLTSGAEASKNVCSGNGARGIIVQAATDIADGGGFGEGSDNVLSSNTCKDNGGDGIALFAGANNVLDANKCLGNGDDGIDLDDTSITDATVSGNTCNENGHEGIDNSGQATVITDNVCNNNGYGIGPDIGGTGDGGDGTVAAFTGNKFGTGGDTTAARLDNYGSTAP